MFYLCRDRQSGKVQIQYQGPALSHPVVTPGVRVVALFDELSVRYCIKTDAPIVGPSGSEDRLDITKAVSVTFDRHRWETEKAAKIPVCSHSHRIHTSCMLALIIYQMLWARMIIHHSSFISASALEREWQRIRRHVLYGEIHDPRAGRHLISAWFPLNQDTADTLVIYPATSLAFVTWVRPSVSYSLISQSANRLGTKSGGRKTLFIDASVEGLHSTLGVRRYTTAQLRKERQRWTGNEGRIGKCKSPRRQGRDKTEL